MTCQDTTVLGTNTASCQYIFVVFNCKNLSTDQTRHTYIWAMGGENMEFDDIPSKKDFFTPLHPTSS